jgi:hypothetical protein
MYVSYGWHSASCDASELLVDFKPSNTPRPVKISETLSIKVFFQSQILGKLRISLKLFHL